MLCKSSEKTKSLNKNYSVILHRLTETNSSSIETFNLIEKFSLKSFHMKITMNGFDTLDIRNKLITSVNKLLNDKQNTDDNQ
jgi:hypothetical protein